MKIPCVTKLKKRTPSLCIAQVFVGTALSKRIDVDRLKSAFG